MKKSKLPLEIEDTIMNLYWKSIFYNKIILFLIHKEEELIDTFFLYKQLFYLKSNIYIKLNIIIIYVKNIIIN